MRALAILLCILGTACTTARLDLPEDAYAVQGANPRIWNRPISFGPFRTEMVDEGTRRSWLADLDVLQITKADQGYHLRVSGVDVECHTKELLLGRSGVFVDPAFGGEPLLVCGYGDGRAVLTLSRTGKSEPSLRGSLRMADGEAFDVRSLHRAAGGALPSLDPWGYEIAKGTSRLAAVETVNRGRVWLGPDVRDRDLLASVAASLLLFEDPRAGED